MNSNGTNYQQEKQHQVDHLFRHHYGQLVASLSKRVGIEHLSLVEDAVQEAMLTALDAWPVSGKPKQPSAWLYQVAYRTLMSEFRTDKRKQTLLIQQALIQADEQESKQEMGLQIPLSKEMSDDMLSLLFICCDSSLPAQSQLVFTL
ncbi:MULTISPECIES: sigma factor [unclassified Marinomonas]|uniref:sigma factor n=1 Tax=unclassified Marinomonas TaxID=196814 RepID=UPI0009EDB615|nr:MULTISPECIES: sigma factor [unclassified Marinomonas]